MKSIEKLEKINKKNIIFQSISILFLFFGLASGIAFYLIYGTQQIPDFFLAHILVNILFASSILWYLTSIFILINGIKGVIEYKKIKNIKSSLIPQYSAIAGAILNITMITVFLFFIPTIFNQIISIMTSKTQNKILKNFNQIK
ncbi:MAG: hypothetical protein LBC17_01275 [Lactobacillaceae bacterium]|jgi:hypothetical protein|nr:hypothetical protein [Lactobacillaceae bacterium]